MIKLLIIADDFTGALDTGVQFANLGVQTIVWTDGTIDKDSVDASIEVLVLNTESRHLPASQAYTLVKNSVEIAKVYGIPFIYKKVDSALRGNISCEIKALCDCFADRPIAFVPAHPSIGRIVKNGCLMIDGVPVSQSVFGQDPYEPVQESDIIKRLQKEGGIECQLVQDLTSVEYAPSLLLFDCESLDDLRAITHYLVDQQWLSMTIGCAGFGAFLAKALFPNQLKTLVTISKPLVVICGSINPITIEQVLYAQNRGIQCISLTPGQLLEPHYWECEAGKKEMAQYLIDAEEKEMLIFETFGDQRMQHLSDYADAHGIAHTDIRFKISAALGNLSRQFLQNNEDTTLLLTGGDTLYQSMKILNVTQIKPIAEISPGVVFSELFWQDKKIHILTKSGGYGHKELFVDLKSRIEEK